MDNRHDIADRLRCLLSQHGCADPAIAAKLLGVDEVELRMSVDELAPYPTLGVLAAVVTHFGMDPTFLVTGRYDRDTHWVALEGGRAAAADLLGRIGSKRLKPMHTVGMDDQAFAPRPELN